MTFADSILRHILGIWNGKGSLGLISLSLKRKSKKKKKKKTQMQQEDIHFLDLKQKRQKFDSLTFPARMHASQWQFETS